MVTDCIGCTENGSKQRWSSSSHGRIFDGRRRVTSFCRRRWTRLGSMREYKNVNHQCSEQDDREDYGTEEVNSVPPRPPYPSIAFIVTVFMFEFVGA